MASRLSSFTVVEADLHDWDFIAPKLAQFYKCIAYDGRGAGQSPSPNEIPNYVEDLKNLLDFFDIHNTVLVGHSIGGQIATNFALTYPQRVSKLVLIAPGLTGYQFHPTWLRGLSRFNLWLQILRKWHNSVWSYLFTKW